MFLRGYNATRGYSAINPDVLKEYFSALTEEATPIVPERGSVGASGDLIPLSYIARALRSEGQVFLGDQHVPASQVYKGYTKINNMTARDALALVNGTSFSSAYLAHAVYRATSLVDWFEKLGGWMYRLLGLRKQALSPLLHSARGHQHQKLSALNIIRFAGNLDYDEDVSRPLQEVYSIRCMPQLLGAVRSNIAYASRLLEDEINGSSDNPVFSENEIIHGGNFHGQVLGFAADSLNVAVVQLAQLADRLIAVLVNPELNGGLPRMLAAGTSHGIQGGQIMASSTLAEMKTKAGPVSIQSIPTNGLNQDIVPMATQACRFAYEQTTLASSVLAVFATGLSQVWHLKSYEKPPVIEGLELVPSIDTDRALDKEINKYAEAFLKFPENMTKRTEVM